MSWDFASVEHFFTSLFEWTSFNHDQCNAILQARNIEIPNAAAVVTSIACKNGD